jgi:hypothetical protein
MDAQQRADAGIPDEPYEPFEEKVRKANNATLAGWIANSTVDDTKKAFEDELARRAAKVEALQENPFDQRAEVSADAKHIASRVVTHMWLIFVLLPVVLGILFAILK